MPPRNARAVRISSNRNASSATAQESSAEWLWSALDIARQAAMSDDLLHVPSITSIAEIFTQMLEQLQVRFI
jgi:hypothetical protein